MAGEDITPGSLCKLFLSRSMLTQVVVFHIRIAGGCAFTYLARRTQSTYACPKA